MRLPTATVHQAAQEDARLFHECLWSAFTGRAARPIWSTNGDVPEWVQLKLSGNLHGFWKRRGYRLRTRQLPEKTGIECWLEVS